MDPSLGAGVIRATGRGPRGCPGPWAWKGFSRELPADNTIHKAGLAPPCPRPGRFVRGCILRESGRWPILGMSWREKFLIFHFLPQSRAHGL